MNECNYISKQLFSIENGSECNSILLSLFEMENLA